MRPLKQSRVAFSFRSQFFQSLRHLSSQPKLLSTHFSRAVAVSNICRRYVYRMGKPVRINPDMALYTGHLFARVICPYGPCDNKYGL
jgi:hypothetical protein